MGEPQTDDHIVRLKNDANRKWSGTKNVNPSTDNIQYADCITCGPFRHICEMGMFSFILFLQKGCEPAAYEDVTINVHSYLFLIRIITSSEEWKV